MNDDLILSVLAELPADAPDTSDTGWLLKVVWPVEDSAMSAPAAITAALHDLPDVATGRGARLVGEPYLRVVDTRYLRWPSTAWAVVAITPATPIAVELTLAA